MDDTSTALFDSYEQDFRHIISGISDKLEGNGKSQQGGKRIIQSAVLPRPDLSFLVSEQRKAALRKVELELDEADDIVCGPISTYSLLADENARYRNLKLRYKEFRSPSRLHMQRV